MYRKFFMAASALAILVSAPLAGTTAKAAEGSVEAGADASATGESGVWDKTKAAVKDTTATISHAAKEAYYDLRQELTGDGSAFVKAGPTVTIPLDNSASALIGRDVVDTRGNTVAKLEDIILDADGKGRSVILRDGGVFGMGGKLVALEYASLINQDAEGDIVIPVSEQMLDQAREFSYDPDDRADANIHVMPAGTVSVAKLMDGDVLTPTGEKTAAIDNIIFENGAAGYVVISFDQTLGMGGDKAVLDYSDVKVTASAENDADITLSQPQARTLENFKKQVENLKS